MPPDEPLPYTNTAITATSPALPAAGGDGIMDTEAGDVVDAGNGGPLSTPEDNTMGDPTGVAKPQLLSPTATSRSPALSMVGRDIEEVDMVSLGNGGPFALSEEVTNSLVDRTDVNESPKCQELRKLSHKVGLHSEWGDFMDPIEKQKFCGFKEAVDSGSLTEQTYESMLDEAKMIQKLIKLRMNEAKNREASLKALKDSITQLSDIQSKLHMDNCAKAVLLIEKMEQQMKTENYKDPIVLCRDLDNLRKKINIPFVDDVNASDKCKELRRKLSHKVGLRTEWGDFMNPIEKRKFCRFKEAVDSGSLTEQTYESMLDEAKMIERLIKPRMHEPKNREASLKALKDSISNLCAIQRELHMDECAKAKLLIKKMEQQMESEICKDPIVFCRDLDKLRKEIDTPCRLPIDVFPSISIEDISFNASRMQLEPFIGHLCNLLIDHDQHEMIKESHLLCRQSKHGDQPRKWMRIRLFGREKDEVYIYVRSDNGYLVAFENKNGIFELGPGLRSVLSRFIPGSVFVECGPDYPSLMNFERLQEGVTTDELISRMSDLELHREAMLDDIHIFSEYSHPPTKGDIQSFQIAVARTIVMICETSRNSVILRTVVNGWSDGVYLEELLLWYIWRWGDMSDALRQWRTNKNKKLSLALRDLVDMVYAEQVSYVIFLVLNRLVCQVDGGDTGDDNKSGLDRPGGNDGKPADNSKPQQGSPSHDPATSSQQQAAGTSEQPQQGSPSHDQAGCTSEQPQQTNRQLQPHWSYSTPSASSQQLAAGTSEQTQQTNRQLQPHWDYSTPSASSQQQPAHTSKLPPQLHCGYSAPKNNQHDDHLPSLINIVPYGRYVDKPIADGYKPQVAKPLLICNWHLRQYPSSPSRGLNELLYQNNNHILQRVNIRPASPPANSPTSLQRWTNSLVEIVEISVNFPFFGTIMVCDQRSSSTLYCSGWGNTYSDFVSRRNKDCKDGWNKACCGFVSRKNKWSLLTGNAAVNFKDTIELVGPSRVAVADGGVTIKACIPATRRKPSEICNLEINCNDSRLYNELSTNTMKLDRGCVYVTTRVVPEALKAFLEVTLQLPREWRGVETAEWKGFTGAKIYGTITAKIGNFDIGSTLFKKSVEEAVPLAVAQKVPNDGCLREKEGYRVMGVPLTRDVLAVPFREYIHITGTLQVCGYDDNPIIIDYLIDYSICTSQNVHSFFKKSGEVFHSYGIYLRPVF